jgi:hypothetical protein
MGADRPGDKSLLFVGHADNNVTTTGMLRLVHRNAADLSLATRLTVT